METTYHVQVWFESASRRGNWVTMQIHHNPENARLDYESRKEARVRLVKSEVLRQRDLRIKDVRDKPQT